MGLSPVAVVSLHVYMLMVVVMLRGCVLMMVVALHACLHTGVGHVAACVLMMVVALHACVLMVVVVVTLRVCW